ncbi:MAG: FAD-binding protein [Clostridiales bacterium]|nr:FAD-binding protein [Clostridiales bacterium]
MLATGGFAANIDMVMQYNTRWEGLSPDIKTTNCAGTTGDGIIMAQNVGAVLEMMDDIMLFPNADPISASTENTVGNDGDAMYVNKEGVRFVNETLDR